MNRVDVNREANPFESPPSTDSETRPIDRDLPTFRVGQTVVTWEKLRWAYNGVLVVVVLLCLLMRPEWLSSLAALGMVLAMGFVVSNICFTVGTLLMAYLAWGGIQSRVMTVVLFTAGTIFASCLACWCMLMSNIQ